MEDKSFRPERRPINPQEIQAHLNQKTEVNPQNEIANSPTTPSLPQGVVKGKVPNFLTEQAQEVSIPNPGELHARAMGATIDTRLNDIIQQIRQTTANFEEITLPSLGMFYDGQNGPSNGKLHVRPMTGHEEEILATQRFVKKGQAVNMIFSRCVQEKYNLEKLLIPDRTYLLIYLRGISYTPSYDVQLKCPDCENKFEETIDLDSLDVNVCSKDFTLESMKGILPTTNLNFSYKLPTDEDEKKVQDYRDQKTRMSKHFDTSGQTDDSLLYRMSILINELAGFSDTNEILQIVRNLPMNDVSHLRNLINFPPFGVDTNIVIHCPNCSSEFEVDLPIESNFFFPRSKPKVKEEKQ